MIVVTGSMRSGTSMWMQVLVESGLRWMGEQFPGEWEDTIGEANPEGFYESRFRFGVHLEDPVVRQISVADTRHHAVKIFVQGLIRTDPMFLHRVIGTIRPFRVVEASRKKMDAMEDDALRAKDPDYVAPPRMPVPLQWWCDNYMLLCDAMRRRYPFRLVAYDNLLADPERVLVDVFQWVGRGNAQRALAQVKIEYRRSQAADTALEPEHASVFDELYDTIAAQRAMSGAFLKRLEATNRALLPRVKEARERIQTARAERRARAKAAGQAEPDPGED